MAEAALTLKLLVDTKARRVIFGEADKNLIDFLFSLLSLPLGTVVTLLGKQCMVGSLGNLYDSVETLNDMYLQSNHNRDAILKPKAVSFSGSALLLLDTEDSPAEVKLYNCKNRCTRQFANDPKATCPHCGNLMNTLCTIVEAPIDQSKKVKKGKKGYVKGVVTYMVMDDLTVKPMSTISGVALLNKFNIKEVGSLEEKVITLDINKGLKLLKASLMSKTALTDVFLRETVDVKEEEEEGKEEEEKEEEEG